MRGSFGYCFCIFYIEFLFFDVSIFEKELLNVYIFYLYIFEDWGVVIYGGGVLDKDGQSSIFFLFKFSVLYGRVVNEIVRCKFYDWILGWCNFNLGYEYLD